MSEQNVQHQINIYRSLTGLQKPEWVLYHCDGCDDYYIIDKRCDSHACPWCGRDGSWNTAIGEGEFKPTKWGNWRDE